MFKGVAKTGKDLTQKFLSHLFRGRFLGHFGLGEVEVTEAVSTELPVVQVKEQRMDFVFRLEDSSFLHLEFQSTTAPADLRRFLVYDSLLCQRDGCYIRTVVFYSNGITAAEARIDAGSILYWVENVFFADYDGDARLDRLILKAGREPLTIEDQLDLIFLGHMGSKLTPAERVLEALRLAETIADEKERTDCVGAIIGMGYQFLDEAQQTEIREVAKGMGVPMDDFLADLAEDYRLEGLAKGLAKGREEGREEGITEGLKEGRTQSILLLLQSRFGEVPLSLREALGQEQWDDRLAALLLAAANVGSLEEFAARVSEAAAKSH